MNKQNLKFKSYDEILRAYLVKQDEEGKKKRDNNWWYASELGTCMRKQFLRRLGVIPAEKQFRISFLGEQGKAIHDRLEMMTKKMGVLVMAEYRLVEEQYRYKGRFDLLVNFGTKAKPYLSLIDIKTQRPEAFFRRSKLPEGKRVNDYQKQQLASYTYFAKKIWPNIKDSRIYYMDRGGGLREEYIFKFKMNAFQSVISELETLNKFWQEKKFPPCSHTWMCKDYCGKYRKEIKKVEKGELTFEEFIKKNV